jgi:tripartite-type tricarboxylate transporter receptor subunit TctC
MMISGPAAMPAPVAQTLENAVREGTRDPGLVQQFADQGVTVEFTSSADLDRVIAEESAMWAQVIKANGVPKTDLKS